MRTPTDVKTELYRDLYFAERARREQIRGSIGTPSAALAFAAFNFSILADEVAVGLLPQPVPMAIVLLMALAVACAVVSALNIVLVEWNFVYHEPPDLREISETEAQLRRDSRGEASDPPPRTVDEDWVARELDRTLAGAFYVAYCRYLAGNGRSARRRTSAQRFVVAALVFLIGAYVLLPFQGAPASPAQLVQ
jgi:uncharacterized membrane protein YidH (DUF202 family)